MAEAAGSVGDRMGGGGGRDAGGEGRIVRRRRTTRARLLQAGYEVMARSGVDAATIKDITDRADVGFGTFYNYFETKNELAAQILDCVIEDFGRRNIAATRAIRRRDPALVMPTSIRLVMREAMSDPMWQWWALRPDLLADRMREGFGPFGQQDMRDAVAQGIFRLDERNIDAAWALAVWMMVGGIHDVVVGDRPPQSEMLVVESIMRVMGAPLEDAMRVSSARLPTYPAPAIDWSFELAASHAARSETVASGR